MIARRSQLLALCVVVALALPIFYIDNAGGADVGSEIVDPLSNQPAGFTTYDAVWDSDMSRMMAVGTDWGDVGLYSLDPSTLAWTQRDDYGVVFRGVDFDIGMDRFVMVGGSSNPTAYVGYDYPTYAACPTIAGAYYSDVSVIGSNQFVAVTNNGRAFYHYFSSPNWLYTEITGGLPDTTMVFMSAFLDTTNDIVWMIGYETTNGWARAYRVHVADILAGAYVAYRDLPQNGEMAYIGGDWSSNDYGIVVGDERIRKLEVSDAGPTFYSPTLFDATKPPQRARSAMVWCDSIKQFLLFGGYNGAHLQDTWLYNPFSAKWAQVTGMPSIPPGRGYHGLGYDPLLNKVILYGGYNGGSMSDTWEITPSNLASGWTQRFPGTSPGALYGTTMTYCSKLGYEGVYLYGGTGTNSNKFYRWDGASWRWDSGTTGPSTSYTSISYDPNADRIIFFGGSTTLSSTYAYNLVSGAFENRNPIVSPPQRYLHKGVSWDRFNGRMTIFGGYYSSPVTYYNDCWFYTYSTNTWSQVSIGSSHIGTYNFAMDVCKPSGNIYIFSGQTSTLSYTDDTSSIGRQTTVTATTILDDAGINPRAVDWYPAGNEAIIAGGNGKIWRYAHSTGILSDVENTIFPAANYNAVACKAPTSPGFAIILGDPSSGLRLNDISGSSPVELDLAGPAISFVNVNTTANQLMLNRQIDVDSGSSSTVYRINVGAGNPSGASQIQSVDVYAWYDEGNTLAAADYPAILGAAFNNAGYENLRMHFRWTRSPETWQRIYPATVAPGEETSLIAGMCTRVDTAMNTTLSFAFSPHQQVRATGSAFVQAPGARFPGDRSTTAALDAPNTWDFKVVMVSAGPITNIAYDEFGFYKYTYLSSGGLPGSLSGSGAPMTTVNLAPVGHVTFSSNCGYRLVTYVDSNFMGDLGGTFSATNMAVQGGDYDFQSIVGTGGGNPVYLLGSGAIYHPPQDSGRTTSTSVGTFGTGAVQWRCYLPSVPQDTYRTSITYLLQNQP